MIERGFFFGLLDDIDYNFLGSYVDVYDVWVFKYENENLVKVSELLWMYGF